MEELTQIRKNTGKSRAYKTGTGKRKGRIYDKYEEITFIATESGGVFS